MRFGLGMLLVAVTALAIGFGAGVAAEKWRQEQVPAETVEVPYVYEDAKGEKWIGFEQRMVVASPAP